MKKFNQFVNEDDTTRSNREIHMVRDKSSKIPQYRGRTTSDTNRSYALFGSSSIWGADHDKLKKYHTSIAKDKGYTVHYHDE